MGPAKVEDACLRVCDILDPDSRRWDEHKVQLLFCEEETISILEILPSIRGRANQLVWNRTKDNRYSVNNDYIFCTKGKWSNLRMTWNKGLFFPARGAVWKLLWKASTPPKVRMLAWRSSHEVLSVLSNLKRRQIVNDGIMSKVQEE